MRAVAVAVALATPRRGATCGSGAARGQRAGRCGGGGAGGCARWAKEVDRAGGAGVRGARAQAGKEREGGSGGAKTCGLLFSPLSSATTWREGLAGLARPRDIF